MSENKTGVLFKAKLANSLAILKSMNKQGVISHKVHFDLWRRLLAARTHGDLDKTTSEIFILYEQGSPASFFKGKAV